MARRFRVQTPGDPGKAGLSDGQQEAERMLLVGVQVGRSPDETTERSLDELAALAVSAGATVEEALVYRRDKPDPATFVGRGQAKATADIAAELEVDTTVFDEELAPGQLRNLEELIPGKVIDRTILILDIFAQRARSAEGKKQVELAQLTYGLPRLRGWGQALSRIGGARGGGGGGRAPIGTRGPGETQLEVDRRRIERRINKLRRDLDTLSRQRAVRRRRREQSIFTASLVGYTNAGKSTLLNHLTRAGVLVEDRLFSTLDPTARRLRLNDGRWIVMTDTVGFIRKLPHGLVEAFKSTLEEVARADALVHVMDASRPHPEADIEAVEQVLADIGAADLPRVLALNKVDILEPGEVGRLRRRFPAGIPLSARTGDGVETLLDSLAERLDQRVVEAEALLPYSEGGLLARLHDQGRVVAVSHEPEGIRVHLRGTAADLGRLDGYLTSPTEGPYQGE